MKALSIFTALVSTLTLCYSAQSIAAVDKRWFEIEVILFSQLDDKTALNETFSSENTLPRYRTIIDLLTPYLYPETQQLHMQLPDCETRHYSPFLSDLAAKLPVLHQEKSLAEIEVLLPTEAIDSVNLNNVEGSQNSATPYDTQIITDNTSSLTLVQEITEPLTDTEKQLIFQAELTLKAPILNFEYSKIPTYQQTLCQPVVIHANSTVDDYIQWSKQAAPTTYPIDKFIGQVDGNEFVYTDKPYLIDADSLQLQDIALQLRRSKNFKPMLHVGWRQPLINRRKPEREPAIRLFTGEHYLNDYQIQLAEFEQKNILAVNGFSDTEELTKEQTTASVSQRLQHIYRSLKAQDFTIGSTVAELDSPTLTLNNSNQFNTNNTINNTLTKPNKPNQNWWLDGLFRLHLNHYLFITADFNIAVPFASSDENKVPETPMFKRIPFSQNKRVISKEVHYFDHPYMGMIVQIRRYKKPEPEPKNTPINH